MRKVIIVVLAIIVSFIGYFFSKNDQVADKKNDSVLKNNGQNIENKPIALKEDTNKSSKDSKYFNNINPPLNMTEEQFNKIMKDGVKDGVVYKSLNELDDFTKDAAKQEIQNLHEKGSLSGGVKIREFSDLDRARSNLKDVKIDDIINSLDGFQSTPDAILEQHNLKLTGAQNFGSYNQGDGWSGVYKLYENGNRKVEIEQIYLKPEKSTQQLIVEALNKTIANETPVIYEKLPSDLIEKLTFVNDRNYYQINAYNLKEFEIIQIANEIINNPNK